MRLLLILKGVIAIAKKGERTGITCNCEWCGKEIYLTKTRYNRAKHHFCSNDCSNKFSNKDKYETRYCKICGKPFDCLKTSSKTFCSSKCQSIWQKDAPRGDNKRLLPIIKLDKEERKISIKKEYKCDYCGKEFVKRESRIRGNHTFCSEECYSDWRHSDLNPTKTEKEVVCDTCGKIFITSGARYNNNKHNYCCLNCANLGKKELWKDSELREVSRKRIIKNLNAGKYSFTKTTPQTICNNLLDSLSIQYINEYSVSLFSIDNYLPEYDLFIEVMGNFWHTNPCFYSSIKYEQQIRGCNRDRKKRLYIKEQMNKNILNLWESDIENDLIKCKALIKLYINNGGELKNYNSFNYSFENNKLTLNNDIIVPFFEREDILENIA